MGELLFSELTELVVDFSGGNRDWLGSEKTLQKWTGLMRSGFRIERIVGSRSIGLLLGYRKREPQDDKAWNKIQTGGNSATCEEFRRRDNSRLTSKTAEGACPRQGNKIHMQPYELTKSRSRTLR